MAGLGGTGAAGQAIVQVVVDGLVALDVHHFSTHTGASPSLSKLSDCAPPTALANPAWIQSNVPPFHEHTPCVAAPKHASTGATRVEFLNLPKVSCATANS